MGDNSYCLMSNTFKRLRAVQWVLLGSILLYVFLSEFPGPHSLHIDATLSYIFSSLAVGIVGTIFVVRRTLVLRAAEDLAVRPDDQLSLNHWKTGYLVTYSLCEALALFGLVLRFRGSGMEQSLLFYIGGFALLLLFRPRLPISITAQSSAT